MQRLTKMLTSDGQRDWQHQSIGWNCYAIWPKTKRKCYQYGLYKTNYYCFCNLSLFNTWQCVHANMYRCVIHIRVSWIPQLERRYCIQLWIRPVLFSPYIDLKLIRPVLNSPNLLFSILFIIYNSISPVLNSPSGQRAKRAKIKQGAKFSLYTPLWVASSHILRQVLGHTQSTELLQISQYMYINSLNIPGWVSWIPRPERRYTPVCV